MTGQLTAPLAGGADTHDMVVVHRVFRRFFRYLETATARTGEGDLAAATAIGRLYDEIATALHHHHCAEDELLWPLLLQRLEASGAGIDRPLVLRMEEQHERVDEAFQQIAPVLARWRTRPTTADRDVLAYQLRSLINALFEHLLEEESRILPLAARLLSEAEWEAIGTEAMSHMPKDRLLFQLGAILRECDPAERRMFLRKLPLPVRTFARFAAPRTYRREMAQTMATAGPEPV